jgi:hypothetical protein
MDCEPPKPRKGRNKERRISPLQGFSFYASGTRGDALLRLPLAITSAPLRGLSPNLFWSDLDWLRYEICAFDLIQKRRDLTSRLLSQTAPSMEFSALVTHHSSLSVRQDDQRKASPHAVVCRNGVLRIFPLALRGKNS